MNLNTGTREPYNKPNNNLLYININSNHLSEIIKNLPENIQKRISKVSSSTRIFSNSKDIYNNDLSANGFQQRFKFEQGNTSATPNKNRKRNICFNPTYSTNITTKTGKIGNMFWQILDKKFKSHTNSISFLTTTTLKLTIAPYQILQAQLTPITKRY